MNDIYKLYNFKYDINESIKAFKQALIDKGLDDKNKFVDFVLKYFPDKSKSTVEDYFIRKDRLCTDSDILKLIHDELNISLQDIFLPNSQCMFDNHLLKIKISDSQAFYNETLGLIDDVLYNSNSINCKSSEEELDEYYGELISLLKIYSYYNYLIQKYISSDLSNDEMDSLKTLNSILTFGKTDIFKYVTDNKDKKNVFSSFYIDNTLCIFEGKKHYLLDYFKVFDLFEGDRLVDVLSIIPPKERNILCSIYNKTNNEKMENALSVLGAKPIIKIDYDGKINNSNIGDVLEYLVDKGVLVYA